MARRGRWRRWLVSPVTVRSHIQTTKVVTKMNDREARRWLWEEDDITVKEPEGSVCYVPFCHQPAFDTPAEQEEHRRQEHPYQDEEDVDESYHR